MPVCEGFLALVFPSSKHLRVRAVPAILFLPFLSERERMRPVKLIRFLGRPGSAGVSFTIMRKSKGEADLVTRCGLDGSQAAAQSPL